MTDRGVCAVGAYAPDERVPASEFEEAWGRFDAPGIEHKAVPSPDEDAVTMAYEAGRLALEAADRSGDELHQVAFATTTPPTAEEDPTIHLGELFDVPDGARLQLYAGSTRAGTQALLDALARGCEGPSLVVASDCPRGEPESAIEHAAGAGAAAFVVGDAPAAVLRARGRTAELAQGTRFRRPGSETTENLEITTYERAVFTRTIAAAVDALGTDVESVDAATIQAPDGALPYRAARALGVDSSALERGTPAHDLGDTGAASVPIGLARTLADGAAETVLAASFGSGAGADALLLERVGDVPARLRLEGKRSITYAEYLRRRGELTAGPPSGGGAYVSVPAWKRTIPQRYRLEAGVCPRCDTLNFPPSGACSHCHHVVEYESLRLDGTGEVEAVTVISQGGAPPEFAEQQSQAGDFAVVIVALEGPGGRSASIPAQVVDAQPDAVAVGDPVSVTIRRIYTQEGVTRYGFKVRPAN